MKNPQKPSDIAVHLGDDEARYGGAVVPPLFQTSLFVRPKDENAVDEGYLYSRMDNPTMALAERKIAALERAESALVFASGMAAISAGILHFLCAGDHALCVTGAYSNTRELFDRYLPRFGVSCDYVSGPDAVDFEEKLKPETKLIYLESPSTALFELQDLRAVAALARSRGIATMIDNTWATPILQQPLSMGIDLVVHSASKYLGGHSDIVGGAMAGSAELIESIRQQERRLLGGCMDAHQAWLLTRGLRTLDLRVRRSGDSALQVSRYLERHVKVAKVFYPGLSSHPQYDLAQRQMSGCSGLMSFQYSDPQDAAALVRRLQWFQNGVSWGGHESLAIAFPTGDAERERLGHPEGLVRLYIGLEDPDTLIDDLEQALAGARA